jgi:diguanylate cyclase (GGDEF)-like protein
MLVVVLATLLFEEIGVFLPMTRRIIHYADELNPLATTDPLTGVLNSRSLFQHGTRELERARRYNRPLALLMIDADHFKHINDTFGHEGGDQVRIALTNNLATGLRATDLLGRIGGDEFIILLPETDTENAEVLAVHLCSSIAALKISGLQEFE